MFKFQNPNLQNDDSAVETQKIKENNKQVKLNLEAGEELNEVSDVDSIQSFTDDDVLDLEHEKRIRKKVSNYKHSYMQQLLLKSKLRISNGFPGHLYISVQRKT